MALPSRIRASSVCVHVDRLLCVRLRDPATGVARWFVPGGAIERGELPIAAAERETYEETGYRVVADPRRVRVCRYPYVWDGVERDVTTHFFAATLQDPQRAPDPVIDAPYNEGAAFIPVEQVPEALGFHRAILEAVLSLLDR